MLSARDLLVLSRVPSLGPNRLRALASLGEYAFRARASDLSSLDGFRSSHVSSVVKFLRGPAHARAVRFAEWQLSRMNSAGAQLVTYWDSRYPRALRTIYDPPAYLFVKGELRSGDFLSLAVVGTRKPSGYGVEMARKFAAECADLGISVVSGLARGIDTAAHQGSLHSGGRTIAVVGSGLDVHYPPENESLSDRIARSGAVLSEYDMGAGPEAKNFPRRNRLISGLALGTLVIESDITGGAMITARLALEQNREVFALPGSVGAARSRGCHALIKSGKAKLVETMADLLEEFSGQLRPLLGRKGNSGS